MKVLAVLALLAGLARAEPSDTRVFFVGLALAPPVYLAGVALHEGSHALAGVLVGATVDEYHAFPPGIDPHTKTFRFGWTYVHGLRTRGDRALFYIAPKITDALLLGGFAALVFTNAWPHDRYGQVALTAGATGLWVDFALDNTRFAKTNDTVKVLDLWCMHGWRELSARAVYAGLTAGLGYVVYRGYARTFGEHESPAPALVLPVLAGAF